MEAKPDSDLSRWQIPLDSAWNRGLVRPLLIALLLTFWVMGPVALLQALLVDWRGEYVLALTFLISLEAVYTSIWLAHPDRQEHRRLRFRLGELFGILIVVRLITWGMNAHLPGAAELGEWLRHPGRFLDPEFVVVTVLVSVAWLEAAQIAHIFEQLALQPEELAPRRKSWREGGYWEPLPMGIDRSQLVTSFVGHWIWAGVFLVLCAGLSRLTVVPKGGAGNLFGLGLRRLDLPPSMIITLVGYFLIGLLLTSQGRLGVLRARWHHERTVGVERVAAQWHRYGLVVLLLIGLLAALLPFGSTFGLARLLETVIFAIARVLNTIVFLLFLLLALLWGLLGGSTRHLSTQAVPPDVVSAFPREGQRLIPDWMSGGIFWLLMGVIVVWALLAFLQGRGLRLDVSLWRRLWASLRAWWYRWRRGLNQTAGQLRRVIARRLARVEEPGDGSRSWRFFRLRTLSPREQVRYFYLAAVRRAGEHGVPRPKSQTPYEYVKALEAHWPEAEPDVEVLTQAFVEARYSQRDFQPEEAKGIQRVWQRVKAVLRQPHR